MKSFVYCCLFFLSFVFITPVLATGEVHVYFIPHQDDEMFMAGHITRDVQNGENVYVVLVTNGNRSNIINRLNEAQKSEVAKDCKFPAWVNCPVQLCMDAFTKVSFTKARDRELLASLTELGVAKDHIYFGSEVYSDTAKQLVNDGSLTPEIAASIIENVEKKLGVGVYSTLFPFVKTKQHHDHKALGTGLRNANIKSVKRFFYEAQVPGSINALSESEQIAKHKALNNYFLWQPEEGRFSIGGHSVEGMLNFWKSFKYEFVTTSPTYAPN